MLAKWQEDTDKQDHEVNSCYTPIGQKKRNKTPSSMTFLMALDGDVDFNPKSLHHLVEFMKKDTELSAVCGRILPTGSGMSQNYGKPKG